MSASICASLKVKTLISIFCSSADTIGRLTCLDRRALLLVRQEFLEFGLIAIVEAGEGRGFKVVHYIYDATGNVGVEEKE